MLLCLLSPYLHSIREGSCSNAEYRLTVTSASDGQVMATTTLGQHGPLLATGSYKTGLITKTRLTCAT